METSNPPIATHQTLAASLPPNSRSDLAQSIPTKTIFVFDQYSVLNHRADENAWADDTSTILWILRAGQHCVQSNPALLLIHDTSLRQAFHHHQYLLAEIAKHLCCPRASPTKAGLLRWQQ